MSKNKFKNLVEEVGLSYKKEIIKILIINIVLIGGSVAIYFFLQSLIYAILLFAGTIILDYFLLTRYNDMKKSILKSHENELIAIISYFEVYIQNNNNVYQSFNQLIPYCSDWMKDRIETLLNEIDEDKSVQPYINFARNFQQLVTHSLMLSIYQMVDQGEGSAQLQEFSVIFDSLSKTRQKELNDQKEKELGGMSIFPLIGAGLITVILTVSILTIIGELIYVI